MDEKKILDLKSIRTDGGTQVRKKLDASRSADYAQDMLNGDVFPPMLVVFDGSDFWLSCGFHRYHALLKNKKEEAEVIVRKGTVRDAILWAMEDNLKHGLRLTNEEKRDLVNKNLDDDKWSQESDRIIAKRCGVSHMTVGRMRLERIKAKVAAEKAAKQEPVAAKEEPVQAPKEPAPEAPKQVADPRVKGLEEKIIELEESVVALVDENTSLTDQLAKQEAMDPDFVEKTIRELRDENKLLRIEVKSLTISRDQFQAENAQLIKQVAMLQKKIKKLEPVA
jgi:hypothetical protein